METVTKLRKLRDIRPNLQKGLIFHAPLDANSCQHGVPYMSYGPGKYTSIPNSLPPFSTNDFTVIAKIKANSLAADNDIVGGNPNSFCFRILTSGRLIVRKLSVGYVASESSEAIVVGSEYVVSYTRSGSVGTYYINGVESGTTVDNYDYSQSVGSVIGAGDNWFNGNIYMCRIFNYALSSEDILYYSDPENAIKEIDRGATGANLLDNGGFDSDTSWATYAGFSISSGKGVFSGIENGALISTGIQPFTTGKRYTIRYTIEDTTDAKVGFYNGLGTIPYVEYANKVNGTYADVFTQDASMGFVIVASIYSGSSFNIDNVSVTQLGCVLDLTKAGMSSSYWYDRTNSLTATNSGAALVNLSDVLDRVSGVSGIPTDVYNVATEGDLLPSMVYDGVNDYTALPTLPAFGTGDFTVVMKVKINSFAYGTIISAFPIEYSTSLEVYLDSGSKTLVFTIASTVWLSSNPLNENQLYSVVIRRQDGVVAIYVDGEEARSTSAPQEITTTAYRLGISWFNNEYLNGSISLCRIFNYALDSDQIAYYSKPENPIKWIDRGASGVNLAVNGGFDYDNNWGKDSGVTIGDGVANYNTSGYGGVYQGVLTLGKKYIAGYDIVSLSSGSGFYIEGATYNPQTEIGRNYGVISNNSFLSIKSAGAVVGSIDNVSVTQLGCLLDLNAEGMTSDYWYDKTNSLTATNSGATLVVPPSSNLGAMAFNGSTSKVVFANNSVVQPKSGDFSIAYSFFNNGAMNGVQQTHIRKDGSTFFMSRQSANSSHLYILFATALGYSAEYAYDSLVLGWNNIAITFQKGKWIDAYINGVRVIHITEATNGDYDVSSDLYIGGYYTEVTQGVIKNMMAWNRALSPEEIKLLNEA